MRPVWTFSDFLLQSYGRFRERSFFQRCGKGEQMRCRLILLITEHPIQQGIRKGGVRHFCDGRTDGRTRTDRMAYSRQLDMVNQIWEGAQTAHSDETQGDATRGPPVLWRVKGAIWVLFPSALQNQGGTLPKLRGFLLPWTSVWR